MQMVTFIPAAKRPQKHEQPDGYLPLPAVFDCEDEIFSVNPGALELCDHYPGAIAGMNEDCDEETNEEGAEGWREYALDADGDGFGVTGDYKRLCNAGDVEGYTVDREDVMDEDNVDCCDSSASTYPDAPGWLSSANSCGSFNKDCRAGEVPELTDRYDGCDLEFEGFPPELVCDYNEGWSSSVPDCGEGGYWVSSCSVVKVGEDCWGPSWAEICDPEYGCDPYFADCDANRVDPQNQRAWGSVCRYACHPIHRLIQCFCCRVSLQCRYD